jgi:hypothetical protein
VVWFTKPTSVELLGMAVRVVIFSAMERMIASTLAVKGVWV